MLRFVLSLHLLAQLFEVGYELGTRVDIGVLVLCSYCSSLKAQLDRFCERYDHRLYSGGLWLRGILRHLPLTI
jgi:hypothetical protein